MKKAVVILISVLTLFVLVGCTAKAALKDADVVGKWRCELYGSELLIEYTPDSRFISHTDGTENRYTVENGCIVTYVEGDVSSEISLDAKVDGDTLTYGGVEYTRVEN